MLTSVLPMPSDRGSPRAAASLAMSLATIWFTAYAVVHGAVIVRVLAVDGKEPVSRAAWVLILLFIPVAGVVLYLLFGEPWVARRWRHRARSARSELASADATRETAPLDAIPERFRPAFRTCERLAAGAATRGNHASLAADSNAAIEGMVRDFDAARATIHVSFYIWLTDRNGTRIVEALGRAARRGVTCRVIADGIGSRALIRSRLWQDMRAAGVRLCTSLQVSFGLGLLLGSRVDLRNHRKIVVVDDRITWCGSQNCADPEFLVKARYAPWVDIMLRFEGPVAHQNQLLFASDWMAESHENLVPQLRGPQPEPAPDGFPAVAFGTGPVSPREAMSDVFVSLLYSAQHEVVISNPYFVPDPSLLAALVCCARRGVPTTLILPARNDSRVVGAISKAYYGQLLRAGVRLFEFEGGLLHAKTLVVDGELALVGSANMDRRSLDLNFENNILLHSATVCRAIRARQDAWLRQSHAVLPAAVFARPIVRRIGDNIATIFGPVM